MTDEDLWPAHVIGELMDRGLRGGVRRTAVGLAVMAWPPDAEEYHDEGLGPFLVLRRMAFIYPAGDGWAVHSMGHYLTMREAADAAASQLLS